MATISILTGKEAKQRPARQEEQKQPEHEFAIAHGEIKATVEALRTQVERLTSDLQTIKADESRGQSDTERARYQGLQDRLTQEMISHNQTQISLAVERAGREWITAQLRDEREGRVVLEARLEQAISTPRPAPAPIEPPSYEMEVVGRDVNSRPQKIRLSPAKGKQ